MDYNELVPESVRRRLNAQQNKMKLEGLVNERGIIIQPYRYVVGLGEKHFRSFNKEIGRLCDRYPWTTKKHLRFIMHELLLNSQFAMLREVVRKIPEGKKVAGYFHVTIFICDHFFSASIEEFGDFFDYFGYISHFKEDHYLSNYYDEMRGRTLTLDELSSDKVKLILDTKNQLRIGDSSNQIAMDVIEKATDSDFYVTSFFKNKQYMWKRIYFRIENHP
ncbi:MAG TPA: hypothetical protein VF857_10355 [Spirochaetota bacterium]